MSITKSVGRLTLWALVIYLFVKGALAIVPRQLVAALSVLIAALVHACCGSDGAVDRDHATVEPAAVTSAYSGGVLEEDGERDLVRVRQGHERPEGGVGLAALDHAEVLGVDGGTFSRLLLRQPLLLPDGAKTEAETLPSALDGPLDSGARPDLGGAVRSIRR